MKIVLVGPEIEENLGMRSLEAVLTREGHRVEVLSFNRTAEIGRAARTILARRPGLVGFSLVAQRRLGDFERLAGLLRGSGYRGHITAGGHFASLRAREVLETVPTIDTILHHDAEERIVQLAGWLEQIGDRLPVQGAADPPPGLDGITWRATDGALRHRPPERVVDLDSLPEPARRRPDRTLGFARAPIVSSRGCSGSCSFCSIHAWHAQAPVRGRLRHRSPEKVAGEMVRLHREHGVRVFIFHDDDFIHPDPREALARARAIFEPAERGMGSPIAFVIKCRPDDVDQDLFAYLKEKGLVRVYVGIETHSKLGLRTLNRRLDPATNLRALDTLRALGIYSCFNLLLFHPDTTVEELEENLAFLAASADIPFDLARAELYARSPLETRMIREGRALGGFRGYDYEIADPRAEAIFRLFAEALWERHFGRGDGRSARDGDSILHLAQDLGYRDSLLRRLVPRMASEDLSAEVGKLIRDVNEDTVAHVRELIALAQRDAGDAAATAATMAELKNAIAARVRARRRTWAALSLEIEMRALLWRAGLAHIRNFDRERSWIRSAPVALRRLALAAPSVAVALSGLSCGNGGTVCDPPPPPYRYSADIEPRFQHECATAPCHSAETRAGGLSLATGEGRRNMVNVPSTELPSMKLVRPGVPDSSYALRKMLGTQGAVGGSGDTMPPNAPPDVELSRELRQWIEDGAPDD